MILAMDEVLRTVQLGLLESAYALGMTRTEVAYSVLLRQAMGGIATAVLLAFGRGIGDTASVLFTAGYTDYIPTGLLKPTATLPLSTFFQLSSPIPEVQNRAYSAAVVLTVIVLLSSVSARAISRRLKRHSSV